MIMTKYKYQTNLVISYARTNIWENPKESSLGLHLTVLCIKNAKNR